MKIAKIGDRNRVRAMGSAITKAGMLMTRFGLAAVVGWIGAMKFTAYEAHGISGFVTNSPLLSWSYHILSVQQFSNAVGVAEVAIATGLIVGAINARIGIFAGLASTAMFLTTLSFMLTTPGTFEATLGFPALSVVPGQFLVKDLVALGASLTFLGQALVEYANVEKSRPEVFSTSDCSPIASS